MASNPKAHDEAAHPAAAAALRVIDIAPALDSDSADYCVDEIADEVRHAFTHDGFLLLRNHGVPLELIQQLRTASHQFFLETPASDKAQSAHRGAPVPRGYSGNRKENFAILAGQQRPNDLVEKFRMGPWRFDPTDPYYSSSREAQMLYYPNKWPVPDAFGLQHAMEAFYAAMESLTLVLLRVFERCLQLPQDFFADKMRRHSSILSVNHYPPVSKQVQRGQLRLAEHTDVDLFTILCPDWDDAAGCLQVKTSDGNWVPVPLMRDALVVNIGDCLHYWTDGSWRSTCHRVAIPDDKESRAVSRLAIAFFVGADHDAPVTRLPSPAPELQQWTREDTTYAGWRRVRVQQAMDTLHATKKP